MDNAGARLKRIEDNKKGKVKEEPRLEERLTERETKKRGIDIEYW